MYQFYARFVPNTARWTQPLHDLASDPSSTRPISWDKESIKQFEENETAHASATLLAFLDPEAEKQLVTDASENSIGCVLQQVRNDITTPLAFWSKGLTKALVCF